VNVKLMESVQMAVYCAISIFYVKYCIKWKKNSRETVVAKSAKTTHRTHKAKMQ